MRGHLSLLVLLTAAGLAACTYFDQQTAPYRQPAQEESPGIARGRDLYMRDCAWCHGSRGEGTSRAPDVVTGRNGPAFTHYMLSTGRMPIDLPEQPVVRTDPIYTDPEIEDIVRFVEALGAMGPGIPAPDPEAGDLDLGARLYQENCAACHSTTGVGGILALERIPEERVLPSSAFIAPGVKESTPTDVAAAMLVGPGTMPVFGEETFSKREVDAIVRYVQHLQQPGSPGGADLGRIGPVTEGAVAWIVGLGLLALLVRWIGTKMER